ncbi:MAG: glycosyltransferase family 1 protein [Chloroflexi bacterium]|nr:glycosyltransferase family 1 protein [Chloroflexota bacterium]
MAQPQQTAVVILSPVQWDFTWQSAQTVAHGLAKRGYHVLFLNPLPKRMPGRDEFARLLNRLLNRPEIAGYSRQPRPAGLTVINPLCLPDANRALEFGNRTLFVPGLLRYLRRMAADCQQLVAISYLPFPTALAVASGLAPHLLIYACQTRWSADPLVKAATLREEQLFRQADLVLADSPQLYEHARGCHTRVYWWPAMVDLNLFHPVAGHNRRVLAAPIRCCYFGGVGSRIDTQLLAKVSQQYALKIVGPVRIPLPALAQGTELVGAVSHAELPRHLADVDVFLFPYRVNAFTEGILPAKVFECLAMGKPVVSTYLPSLLQYQNLVYISRTHDEFLANISRATAEDKSLADRRVAIARQNSTDYWLEVLHRTILNWLDGQHAVTWPDELGKQIP